MTSLKDGKYAVTAHELEGATMQYRNVYTITLGGSA